MKLAWNGYWKPTPKKIRKAADALLAGAMTVSTFAMMNDYPKLAGAVMITAGVAKFFSNFFSEETPVE